MVRLVEVSPEDEARPGLFEAWAEVFEASGRVLFGDDNDVWSADQRRERWRSTSQRDLGLAAVDGEDVVGAVQVSLPLKDNLSVALVELAVLPDRRRRGIGSLLLDRTEEVAASHGRTVILAETRWPAGATDEGGEGFAARRGYAAAQTVLRSSLELGPLARPEGRARLAELAGDGTVDGYSTRTFVGGIPEDWLEARAELSRAMSTDAPIGDLQVEEENWDAARVAEDYERVAAMGRTAFDTFAMHEETGEVAGYTQVQVTRERPRVAYQQDTLVRKGHRGHGLGLRLKAANALRLVEESPGSEVVRTWNADDNVHMLAVNRQLGFVVDAYLREWQKVLG